VQASGWLLTPRRPLAAAFGPGVRRLNIDGLGLTHAAGSCGSSRGLTGLFALSQPGAQLGALTGCRGWVMSAAAVAAASPRTGLGGSALEACAEESLDRLRGLSWAMRHMLPVRSSACAADD